MKLLTTLLATLVLTACGTEADFEEKTAIRLTGERVVEVCKGYEKGSRFVVTEAREIDPSELAFWELSGWIKCTGQYDEGGFIPLEESETGRVEADQVLNPEGVK